MKLSKVLRIPLTSVLLASMLVACGDDGESPSSSTNSTPGTNNATTGTNNGTTGTNNGTTSTNNEASGTNNATTGTNNETPACEPLDEFACVTCGALDDGCGGMIDCGACPCVDGVPSHPTCGACDIGISTCETNETGLGGCDMPIPGIEALTCFDMVFVASGPNGGDGSKVSPFRDILEAVADADARNKRLIVVGGDGLTYSMGDTLELVDGVHIIGGFENNFTPAPANKPVFINDNDAITMNTFAARAINIEQTTHLKNVELRSRFAPTFGANTFGLWADNASGLVLTNVTLSPGRAGAGVPGTAGADGLNANNKSDGITGHYRSNENQAYPLQTPPAFGGAGCEGSLRGGGFGGKGAGYSSASNPSVLMAAMSGTIGGGAPGANFTTTAVGTSGRAGSAGNPGTLTVDGAGGDDLGMMDPVSYFVRQANGSDGGQGEHGFGGGGGGGAGAYDRHTGGPSGGGGGGGGCGGDAGTGGQQGGSSFALVLRSSPGLSYSDLELVPGPGGAGAAGGQGGEGGLGGLGGAPGNTLLSTVGSILKQSLLVGGRGGDGGRGARGGHGGGGAGGHSIAVWCDGAYDISAMTKTPSPGGAGGFSHNPASKGADGRSSADYGCNNL